MSAIAPASTAARVRSPRHTPLALALAAALVASAPAVALGQVASTQLPTGGSLAGGNGTINPASGANLTIDQASSRLALTWTTFDIGSAASVTFNQPSSSAAVLNLIQGGNPTQIFGHLNANGQVFLINPSGMVFGSTAQINVGGLVASTLSISAGDFLSGNDVLATSGVTASVSNGGTINAAAGAVDLIGGKVLNTGTITASAGNINLVGADQVTLTFESGGFGVVVDKALQAALGTLAVDNSGTLSAPGGVITLQARAAQGLFDQLINNSNVISAAALSSSGSDGSVSLVANGAGQTGIGGSGSIDVGSGAISISTDRSVQQSGVYTAGTLSGSIGGNASFSGANRIATLGNLHVGGNLALSSAIGLGQAGALDIDGASTFSLSGSNLALTNAGNTFDGTVTATANDIAVSAAGDLTIGGLTQASNHALSLSAGGALTLPGTAINTGSADLTLRSGGELVTAAALTGNNVSLTGDDGIALRHSVNANGTLALTTDDANITQTTALQAGGTATIDAGNGAIVLTQNNDFQSTVHLTGAGISVYDRADLQVGSLTAASNSAVDLQAVGSLSLPTQAIDTGTADLTLVAGGAALGTNGSLRGRNVLLVGRDALTLNDDVTATGTLQLSSVGNIVQTGGVLDVGALATVNANSGAIALTSAGNEFRNGIGLTGTGINVVDQSALLVTALNNGANGALSLTAGGALTLPTQVISTGSADLALRANGGVLSTSGALTGRNLTLSGRDGVTLGENVTSSGTLAVSSSGGAVTQSDGVLDVAGAATFTAGGAIAVDAAGNDFKGTVSLSGTDIKVVAQNALDVTSLANGSNGAVWLQAGGMLTLPTGVIDTGTADLTLISGGSLSSSAALAGHNVSLTGASIALGGDVDADGTLALTSSNASIQQTAGALRVGGTSRIDAGTGAIVLDSAGNHFSQAVSLTGGITSIVDSGALILGTLSTGNLSATSHDTLNLGSGTINGTLTATSNGGAIGQAAGTALSVAGTSSLDAGIGSITLTTSGNDFGQAVSLTGGITKIADSGALTLGTLSTGDLSATSHGALTLGSGTINGSLTASSNGGAISQSGALSVAGSAGIAAGNGTITLDRANDFRGVVGLTGGNAVLANAGALTLAASTLGGNLAIDASGAIGQSGALQVTGASSFQSHGNAIDLSGAGNNFQGAVSLGGGITSIADGGALTLGTLSTGDLSATSHGALTLGSGTINGSLTATSNGGAIGQAAGTALSVAGTSTLDAGTGAIALTSSGNDFGQAVSASGYGIALADANDLTIAALALDGNSALSLYAAGTLTLPGSAINTGSADLSLHSGNRLTTQAALSGHNVSLSGTGISLGYDVAATGNLLLSSDNAAILQSGGALTVGGNSTLATGSGDITLTGAGNHFGGTVDIAGGAVQLRDSGALSLGTLSVDSLAVRSGGALNLGSGSVRGALQADSGNAAIGQRGALDIGGATRLSAGSGAITLDQANRFAGTLAFDGGAVRIDALGALTLGASTATALQLSNSGALGQNGALQVTGDAAIATGNGAIALDDAGNDFQGVLALSGGAARIRDANALSLGTLSLGSLDVASHGALNLGEGSIAGDLVAASGGGAVSQRGALQVGGSTTIDSGSGAIALDTAGNDFQGAVNLAGGATSLRDRNALSLGSVAVAALNVTSGGALSLGQGSIGGDLVARSDAGGGTSSAIVTASAATPAASGGGIGQRGALTVAGATTLDAGSGAIALSDAGNDFQGTVQASGGAIAIADRNDLAVAAQANGSLALSAAGALRTAGALSGSSIGLSAGGDLGLAHDVTSSGSLQLRSGGAIAQTAGTITAASLSGSSSGATSLTGANAIAALGAFSATQLSLRTLGDLSVTGPVAVAGALRLDAGGDLAIGGALGGQGVWLQAGGDLSETGSGRISADTLSGKVGGSTRLGAAGAAIDNRIGTLGDFSSPGGFSLTNGQSLTLSALNGSAYTVDAGTSVLYLAVLGDLLQADTTWLHDGAGTFSASGRIGTAANPIYVLGVSNQTVAAIGLPPAYFYAVAADGSLLGVVGESGINVPTSAFASRAQSSSNRTIAYVDLSAANANYRAFGLVKPGLRLPADQQPACDADDPDAQCTQE